MKKCPLCRKVIEKLKGCDHLKCHCGFEFCYFCEERWSHSHICQDKIPVRSGFEFVGCFMFKGMLGLLLGIVIFFISVLFSAFICFLSAMLFGVMIFIKTMEKIPSA